MCESRVSSIRSRSVLQVSPGRGQEVAVLEEFGRTAGNMPELAEDVGMAPLQLLSAKLQRGDINLQEQVVVV